MIEYPINLTGKVALVSGGGHGLGADISRRLAAAGAKVCIGDLNPDRAEAVAEAIKLSGGDAFGMQGDVGNKFQVAAWIETLRARYGGFHILVNAAHAHAVGDVLTMGEWEVRRVAEVNLVGSFLVAQLAARVMTDEVGGHIFLLSSTEETGKETAYTMTQGAVRALAHALDRELVGRNVQVITVPRTSQGLDTILQTCMPF